MALKDRGKRGLVARDQSVRLRGASWLETQAVVLFDDFMADTIDATPWAITSPQATGGTDWAIDDTAGDPVAGHGGWASATTGTGDNDNEVINGKIVWRADRAGKGMLVFEARISLPSVAGVAFQAGLTDAVNEVPFRLGASDAITSTATDAAVWIYDVDADTDQWFGLNVDSDTDGALLPTGGVTEVATDPTTLRIEIDVNGGCYYYHANDAGSGEELVFKGYNNVGVTPTVALGPFANVLCTAGSAAKVGELDYILTACAR